MCKKVTDDGKTRLTCNLFRRGASNGITMQTEEQELIRRIAGGETRLCARLVDRYGRAVYTLAARIAGCTEDAEELTQDIFLKAFSSLDRFGGRSSFSTWLYRIAYNTPCRTRGARVRSITASTNGGWRPARQRGRPAGRVGRKAGAPRRAEPRRRTARSRGTGAGNAVLLRGPLRRRVRRDHGTLGRQRQGAAPPNPEKTICTGKRRDEWNRVMRYAARSGKFRPRNCPQASPRG